MKTVKMHRKYAICTTFLDSMLEREEVVHQNESELDAYRRGFKALDEIAATLRKEEESMRGMIISESSSHRTITLPSALSGGVITISRDWEKLEIAIDNAETSDRLKEIGEDNPLMPAPIRDHFNKRMKELLSESPK